MSRALVAILAVLIVGASVAWARWTRPDLDDEFVADSPTSEFEPPTTLPELEGNPEVFPGREVEAPPANPYEGEVDVEGRPIDPTKYFYYRVLDPDGRPIGRTSGTMSGTSYGRGVSTTLNVKNGWSYPTSDPYPDMTVAPPPKRAPGQPLMVGVRVAEAEFARGVCVIVLPRARALHGSVHTADGEPATFRIEAKVVRDDVALTELIPQIRWSRSGEDGRFQLLVPENDHLDVEAWSSLGKVSTRRVSSGADTVALTVDRSSRLEIRVTGPNGERPDGTVQLIAQRGVKYKERTLKLRCVDGLAVTWSVPPGIEFDVVVEAPPFASWHRSGLRVSDRVVHVDLVAGEPLSGTIVDRDGKPVRFTHPVAYRVVANALDAPDRYMPPVRPEKNGKWEFPALVPGRYRLELRDSPDLRRVSDPVEGTTGSASVELVYTGWRR